ncbi:hypothetical protein M885DRAFT_573160 [Pelagophyceae sp. CCMP2097]|nr:hypothetical protein M885DRAFT_573160 [Pelagophyceae sp. CCMP2097]
MQCNSVTSTKLMKAINKGTCRRAVEARAKVRFYALLAGGVLERQAQRVLRDRELWLTEYKNMAKASALWWAQNFRGSFDVARVDLAVLHKERADEAKWSWPGRPCYFRRSKSRQHVAFAARPGEAPVHALVVRGSPDVALFDGYFVFMFLLKRFW